MCLIFLGIATIVLNFTVANFWIVFVILSIIGFFITPIAPITIDLGC
jgi:hypothetical protein